MVDTLTNGRTECGSIWHKLATAAAADDVNRSDPGTAIANLTVDIVTVLTLCALAVALFVLYFGKGAYRLVHLFLCYRTPDALVRDSVARHGRDRAQWRTELGKKMWLYVIINSCVLFVLVRIFHECLTIGTHSLNLAALVKDDPWLSTVEAIYLRYPRRLLDALVMWHYFAMYSLLVPIWLQCSLVWISRDGSRGTLRRVVSIVVYMYVALTNAAIVVVFLPLAIMAFAGWILPRENHTYIDELRNTYIAYVCLPLEAVVLASITIFTIALCSVTVHAVRTSVFYQVKRARQVRQQINTIARFTVGIVLFSVCSAVRISGYILYTVVDAPMPNYIIYPLTKAVPDIMFLISVCVVFWPYHIPCIGAPIVILHEFSDEIKQLAAGLQRRRKNLQVSLVDGTDEDERTP